MREKWNKEGRRRVLGSGIWGRNDHEIGAIGDDKMVRTLKHEGGKIFEQGSQVWEVG